MALTVEIGNFGAIVSESMRPRQVTIQFLFDYR